MQVQTHFQAGLHSTRAVFFSREPKNKRHLASSKGQAPRHTESATEAFPAFERSWKECL